MQMNCDHIGLFENPTRPIQFEWIGVQHYKHLSVLDGRFIVADLFIMNSPSGHSAEEGPDRGAHYAAPDWTDKKNGAQSENRRDRNPSDHPHYSSQASTDCRVVGRIISPAEFFHDAGLSLEPCHDKRNLFRGKIGPMQYVHRLFCLFERVVHSHYTFFVHRFTLLPDLDFSNHFLSLLDATIAPKSWRLHPSGTSRCRPKRITARYREDSSGRNRGTGWLADAQSGQPRRSACSWRHG
jgi:hypothetical protein